MRTSKMVDLLILVEETRDGPVERPCNEKDVVPTSSKPAVSVQQDIRSAEGHWVSLKGAKTFLNVPGPIIVGLSLVGVLLCPSILCVFIL